MIQTRAGHALLSRLADGLLLLFGLALAALAVATLVLGWDYYALDRAARAEHELHGTIAPGAGGGLALGVLGTGLMLAMLSYTARKVLVRIRWLGPLDKWLKFHIVCGVMGPVFIVLHSGLQWPTGLIAIAFWCMVLVALSGGFGRYVYGFFPRLANGRSMALTEALSELTELRARLVQATASSRSHAIGEAVELVQGLDAQADSFADLLRLALDVRRRRQRVRVLLARAELPTPVYRQAVRDLDEQLDLKRGLEASRVVFRMFRYWHLFHRPLAAAMYVIVALHVLIALLFGDSLPKLLSFLGVA